VQLAPHRSKNVLCDWLQNLSKCSPKFVALLLDEIHPTARPAARAASSLAVESPANSGSSAADIRATENIVAVWHGGREVLRQVQR
jgi:hypothetical protein